MGWELGGEHLNPSPGDVELARLSWLLAPGCAAGEAAGPCCCCDGAWCVFFFFCFLYVISLLLCPVPFLPSLLSSAGRASGVLPHPAPSWPWSASPILPALCRLSRIFCPAPHSPPPPPLPPSFPGSSLSAVL